MPQAEQNPGRERRLPIRLRRNNLVHEREQPVRIILDLDIDIEFDVLVFRLSTSRISEHAPSSKYKQPGTCLHEQLYRLRKGGNGLLRLFPSSDMLHSVFSEPIPFLNLSCGRSGLNTPGN